ncbi:lipopolysaccharide assembly protein LapA domain-containing protein [Aureimonas mangrovi]|uniref:lipopolysaccharide assembly protein LapA domain-containing protein n=1 Tax=Aureimonas mangrovi TaxID=2758041 RepID=UPI00163D6282|nr:lipopolysaccharide assembly protein LapA domain-containing protein [Aureimonas mangrovi]
MISRLLSIIVLVPLAILIVIFCVVNREPVSVSMDALGTSPQLAFQAPLFVLILASLILGVLLGGIATFVTQARYRARAARRARELETLRQEVDASNERLRREREDRERERAAQATSQATAQVAPPAPRDAPAGLAAPAPSGRPAIAGPRAA